MNIDHVSLAKGGGGEATRWRASSSERRLTNKNLVIHSRKHKAQTILNGINSRGEVGGGKRLLDTWNQTTSRPSLVDDRLTLPATYKRVKR